MPRSNLEYVGIGAAVYVGGLLVYNAIQNNNQGNLSNNHRRVENRTEPPPIVRTPAQGNGLYGYFGNWFYGTAPSSNHTLDL